MQYDPPVRRGLLHRLQARRAPGHPVLPPPRGGELAQGQTASGDAAVARELDLCFERTLRWLLALGLADYLRGPPADAVEQLLPGLHRPSLGHYASLVREVARALGARERPFCAELPRWLFAEGELAALDTLVRERNHDEHGTPLASDAFSRRVADRRKGLLRFLTGLRWLAGYRPFRVLQAEQGDEHMVGRLQFFVGAEKDAEGVPAEWTANLPRRRVYVAGPRGDGVLDVAPFLSWRPDAAAIAEHLFLFKSLDADGRLVLDSPTCGSPVTGLAETRGGTEVAFVKWLATREDRAGRMAQPTRDPSGAFAVAAAEDGRLLGGQFEVRDVLGRGSMATVYRVFDTLQREERALKVLHDEYAGDTHARNRFQREVDALRRARHPHVLANASAGLLDGRRPYLSMPLALGGTLRDRLDAGRPDRAQAGRWMRQLLAALEAVHALGLVHRDVKPSNLLLDHDDRLLLCDFGIVWEAGPARLTRTAQGVGTQGYMPPEQQRGDVVTDRADVYAAGVVLYELLTGKARVTTGGLGGGLAKLVTQMTAEDPADRPSASEARERLVTLLPDDVEAPPVVEEPGAAKLAAAAEARASEAQAKLAEAEARAKATEAKLVDAEARALAAETRLRDLTAAHAELTTRFQVLEAGFRRAKEQAGRELEATFEALQRSEARVVELERRVAAPPPLPKPPPLTPAPALSTAQQRHAEALRVAVADITKTYEGEDTVPVAVVRLGQLAQRADYAAMRAEREKLWIELIRWHQSFGRPVAAKVTTAFNTLNGELKRLP